MKKNNLLWSVSAMMLMVACGSDPLTEEPTRDMESSVDMEIVEDMDSSTETKTTQQALDNHPDLCGNWTFQSDGVNIQGFVYSYDWNPGMGKGEVFTEGANHIANGVYGGSGYQELLEDPSSLHASGYVGGLEVSDGYAIAQTGTSHDSVYIWGKPIFSEVTEDYPIDAELNLISNSNGCLTYQVTGQAASYNWLLDYFFPGEIASVDFQYTFELAIEKDPDIPTQDRCMRWETHFTRRGMVGNGYLARWDADPVLEVLSQDSSFFGIPPKTLGMTGAGHGPIHGLVGSGSYWSGRYHLSDGSTWNDGGGSYQVLSWLSPKIHVGSWSNIVTKQGSIITDEVHNYFVAAAPNALPPYCEGITESCSDDLMEVMVGTCSNVLMSDTVFELKEACLLENMPVSCEEGSSQIQSETYEECVQKAADWLEEKQQGCTDKELERRAECEAMHPPGEKREDCYADAAADYWKCSRRYLALYAGKVAWCRIKHPRDPEDQEVTNNRDQCLAQCNSDYMACTSGAIMTRENCENACPDSSGSCYAGCYLSYLRDMWTCRNDSIECNAKCEQDYP